MKKPLLNCAAVFLIGIWLTGCVHPPVKGRAIEEGSFGTRNIGGADGPSLQVPAVPAEQQPIVRIIKGEQMESLEEARQIVARQETSFPKGMQEMLHSLIFRGVRVRTIAELLTDICGYNVVATNRVADKEINIYLKSLSLREVLESICRLNNIWYREGQGIITLMTRDEYVRDIEVRQSDQTRAFFIRYTNAADMAKVIQAAMGNEVHLAVIDSEKIYGHIDPEQKADVGQGTYLKPELTAGPGAGEGKVYFESFQESFRSSSEVTIGKSPREGESRPLLAILTVFKRNNCIVARSLDGGLLNEISRIIETLDTPTSQVLLEIKILQLTLDDNFESFFDFNWRDSKNFLGILGSKAVGTTTLDYLFGNEQINARISFFEREGRAQIIATPFLMAANNSKVEFFVGEETPLRDDVTTSTVAIGEQGDTITTFQVNIIREELGTDVKMTTFINADSTVTLEFDAEISSAILNFSTIPVVNPQTGQTIEFPLDAKSKSELKSILSAKSGQSIAIGGIIRETLDLQENKVPLLGDIPALGFFFREISHTRKKTETVIILTPHVIMHPTLAGQVSDEFLNRKSSHEVITRGKENILDTLEEAGP